VLSALEALGMPLDLLVGTSIGGIVAALYAVGYGPDAIEAWFRRARPLRLLGADPANTGFVGNRKIGGLFREALDGRTFEDVRIPLALVAVDVVKQREVVMRDGTLVEALLATSALPGIFPPVARGDEVLVDGGVLNNLPVDVALALGAERVIAVDLGLPAEEFALDPASDLLSRVWTPRRWLPLNQLLIVERALAIMTREMTERRLAQTPPAVLLRPAVGSLRLLDFARVADGRRLGEQAVSAHAPELVALRDWRLEGS
jgi:NTE family protein